MFRKCIRRKLSPWLFLCMALGCALSAAALPPGCATTAAPTCSNTTDWSGICQTGTSVGKWQCWQKDLTSTNNYPNGYRDVRISVTFTSTQYPGVTYTTKGFWNGKTAGGQDQFAFRMAFGPYPGTWTWTATCASSYSTLACNSDSGLTGSGTVTVTPAAPAGHPIYQKGFLQQATSTASGITTYQPPSHFDKNPFLWHGDTAWAASTQACRNQWRDYVDNRKTNGFTIVHLALAPEWAGQPATSPLVGPLNKIGPGQAPFETLSQTCPSSSFDRETIPNCQTRWKPDFWREIDGMVQYANQQGLTVYIPGLIQPYQEWPSTEAVKVFTRNFVARMRGYAVVLSPGFDSDPEACEPGGCARKKLALMDAAGSEVRSVDPAYPLLINHHATIAPGTVATGPLVVPKTFAPVHPKSWLNAHGYQSGFSDAKLLDLTNRPRVWAQEVRFAAQTSAFYNPRKPAINTESIYDYGFSSATDVTAQSVNHYNAFRARQAGYSSWLAGATGYSFGAAGLWEWGVCSLSPLPSWAVDKKTCESAQNPVPQTGYTNFKFSMCNDNATKPQRALGDQLRQVRYWTLVGNEQWRIKNNGTQAAYHQMVVARDRNQVMVYMPHNSAAQVDLSGLQYSPGSAGISAKLLNPRDNMAPPTIVTPSSVSTNIWNFANPTAVTSTNIGSADWLLVIEPAAAATGSRRLDTWVGTEEEEGQRGLWGRIKTFDGSRAPEPFLIAAGESELPRGARVAREAGGDFLVVWEGRDAYDETSEIRAQWVSEEGVLLGDMFALSATRQAPDQTSPTVVFDSSNQGLVAWVERDASAAASLVVRNVVVGGEAVGGLLRADDVTAAEPREPRLACGATGACYIAWESVSSAGSVSLRSRPFDALRTGFQTAGVVLGQAGEDLWLSTATVNSVGLLVTSWEELDGNRESLGWSSIAMDEAGVLTNQ